LDPWLLVRTGLLPAVVAGAGGLVAVLVGVNSRRAAALLFALGVLAGFAAEFGIPLPVSETFEWPVLAMFGIAVLVSLWPPGAL
jgi:hypothetical protein